jgi:hypothetical protein
MSGPLSDLRRAPRGQISWVTLLLLVLVVGGGYLALVWLPVYYENHAVKQVVRDYMNQAIKNPDDEVLRRAMVLKIRSLARVDGVDAWGRPARLPAVALEDGDVDWHRDRTARPPVLRVSFEYARDVTYPLLERTATRVFSVELSNDLTMPDWGTPR